VASTSRGGWGVARASQNWLACGEPDALAIQRFRRNPLLYDSLSCPEKRCQLQLPSPRSRSVILAISCTAIRSSPTNVCPHKHSASSSAYR
jgi:hypothetical protein